MRTALRPSRFAIAAGALIGAIVSADAEPLTPRQDFMTLCADCHNADARGNGPLTKHLTKVPPDLTRIKQRSHGRFDETAVYDWILGLKMTESHGTREMPIWGDWLMDETMEDDTSLDAARPRRKRSGTA